jgi:hypothetical protein
MSLMPSRVTPKQWLVLVVAVIAIAFGAYLIYDNTREEGQAVKGSGMPPAAASTTQEVGTPQVAPTPTPPQGSGKPTQMVPGPRKIAPK